MKSYDIGLAGEESASLYLESLGWEIIGRRVRIGHSEIDIIAKDGNYLVFVEVKSRRTSQNNGADRRTASASVDYKKQNYLIRAADEYLLNGDNTKTEFFRIDVVEVYIDNTDNEYKVIEINLIKNAVRRKSRTGRYGL